MAKVSIKKIKSMPQPMWRRENSHTRLAARKIGLEIPEPEPSLPIIAQEASDIG